MMPGTHELIVIFLIVLLIFGGKKIPEIARGLGKGIREFKKAKDDIHDAVMTAANEVEEPKKTTEDPASERKREV